MKNMELKATVLVVLGALSLAGCGSGSSSASATLNRSGAITGFGSVFVNGVEYESSAATVTTDGVAADESKLGLGMVVKLKGSVNADGIKGTALSISYDDELKGIVQANTVVAGKGTLTVMGQTVNVDTATIFKSKVATITSMEMITAGNIVEVSGYTAGDGTIYATRVEVKKLAMTSDDEIKLKGLIASLDSTAKTFKIGMQLIDYSAAKLDDIPNGMLANDMYVEVKSKQVLNGMVLIASKVELEGDGKKGVDASVGEELELEGIVTDVASATEFTLNDQVVLLSGNTKFEHGTSASIVKGARLEVEGTMNADRKLVAEKVKLREEGDIEIEALVGAVDVGASTVTVLGKVIHVNSLTALEDDEDDIRYFSLKDIAVYDTVKIEAYLDAASGDLIATKLKRESRDGDSDDSKLEGTVDSVSGLLIVIAGISVDLTNADRSDFGGVPTVGTQVKVSGTFANNSLTATKIEQDD